MAEGIILTDAELVELNKKIDTKVGKKHTHSISDVSNLQTALNGKASTSHSHNISDISNLQNTLNNKARASDLSSLQVKVDKKVSSDTVKNIAIIEKGASTTSIPANTLIFEKE